MATVTVDGIGGPFLFRYYTPPVVPSVLRDIKRQRAAVGPVNGSNDLPSALAERFLGTSNVPIYFVEPDPVTSHDDYYYNSRLNKLYVRVNTSPVPVWRPIGG